MPIGSYLSKNQQPSLPNGARVSPAPQREVAGGQTAVLLQRAAVAPHTLSPGDVAQLQRLVGNRMVGALAGRSGGVIQRGKINKNKAPQKNNKSKKTKTDIGRKSLLTARKKDIHAGKLVAIFQKNKGHPSVVRLAKLSVRQKKLFEQLDVERLAVSEKRELNQALDEIQKEIKTAVKEATKDDPTAKELQAWYQGNATDTVAVQLKSLLHNMFSEKPHSVPPGVDIAKTYHTGEQNDPIPIVWYKPESDYKPIRPASSKSGLLSLPYPTGGTIGGLNFGVAAQNRPSAWTKSNPIKKVFHESDRGNQKSYNAHLRNHGYRIGDAYNLDGDHVLDLGFNGQDELANYWPLKSEVNRRAFHGYNEQYVLNYYVMEKGSPVPKAKSIGGLINRYFYIKGYLTSGSVPAESGTAKAGTEQV